MQLSGTNIRFRCELKLGLLAAFQDLLLCCVLLISSFIFAYRTMARMVLSDEKFVIYSDLGPLLSCWCVQPDKADWQVPGKSVHLSEVLVCL